MRTNKGREHQKRDYVSGQTSRDALEGVSDMPSKTILLGKISKMEESARNERKEYGGNYVKSRQSKIKMQDTTEYSLFYNKDKII